MWVIKAPSGYVSFYRNEWQFTIKRLATKLTKASATKKLRYLQRADPRTAYKLEEGVR